LYGFETAVVDTRDARIFVRHGGAGPPVLLLHGFPQTHLMWGEVAASLARDFTVVCADLLRAEQLPTLGCRSRALLEAKHGQ
jgi:pimeloyl-ACP methyl ester carboxylesterase